MFKKWATERAAERQHKRDEELAERKRKGILSGREIFSEVRPQRSGLSRRVASAWLSQLSAYVVAVHVQCADTDEKLGKRCRPRLVSTRRGHVQWLLIAHEDMLLRLLLAGTAPSQRQCHRCRLPSATASPCACRARQEGFLAEDDLGASDMYDREDAEAQEVRICAHVWT